jgi:putative ABC transport system permease protein
MPDWVFPNNINSLVLRLDETPRTEFGGLIRRAIYEVDPRIIVESANSIEVVVENSLGAEHYAFMILKGLSAIAFGLTILGLFAVIAYTVDSRMSEFGIRIALGSTPFALHRLVMVRGLTAASIGLGVGIIAAMGLARFMKSLLFETTPYDPAVYAGVSAILIFAGVIACWMPARRASRLDVVKLLRAE